jgi:Tfp pilus assembly protein PilX
MIDTGPPVDDATGCAQRCEGDRGSGMVTGIALIFAFTFLGLVWLARDVDRGVSNQSAAQSIAFQAARSGAQAAQVDRVRSGEFTTLDVDKARLAANDIAVRLFASYGVNGAVDSVEVDVLGGKVTVTVRIVDGSKTVTGVGTVRAEQAA